MASQLRCTSKSVLWYDGTSRSLRHVATANRHAQCRRSMAAAAQRMAQVGARSGHVSLHAGQPALPTGVRPEHPLQPASACAEAGGGAESA